MLFSLPSTLVALLALSTSVLSQSSTKTTTTTSASNSLSTNRPTNSTSSATSTSPATTTTTFPSLQGYSACVVDCFSLGVSTSNCSSVINVDCYCASKNFTKSLVSCLSKTCASDTANGEMLVQQFCAVASPSTSLSFPSITANTSTTSPPGTVSVTLASTTLAVTMTTPSTSETTTTSAGNSASASASLIFFSYSRLGMAAAGMIFGGAFLML